MATILGKIGRMAFIRQAGVPERLGIEYSSSDSKIVNGKFGQDWSSNPRDY